MSHNESCAFPRLNLQLQGMQHSIMTALAQHHEELARMVQDSINRLCTVENLKIIIDETAKSEIEQAIKEQIRKFYAYGEGKIIIENAVKQTLSEKASYYREAA